MKIKLKQIIGEFLSSADLSEHAFLRLYNIGVRGAREMNMDVYGSFKTKLLPVAANKTVQLPVDYISLSKIGLLNDAGEVITLHQNNDLSNIHQQYIADLQQNPQVPTVSGFSALYNPAKFPFLWLNFGYNSACYNLFGLGGGTANLGEYKVQEDLGVILLSQDWPYATVLVEYLSSGFDDEDDDYMVDERAAEAMLCYLRWKNATDARKKFGLQEVSYFKKEYYRERAIAKLRINRTDITEMQAVFRSNVKLTARA